MRFELTALEFILALYRFVGFLATLDVKTLCVLAATKKEVILQYADSHP